MAAVCSGQVTGREDERGKQGVLSGRQVRGAGGLRFPDEECSLYQSSALVLKARTLRKRTRFKK